MKWCFAGSDLYVCCYCNVGSEECSMADWTIDYYRHEGSCYKYTCSLTIHKVSMNYSDGILISAAAESSVNYTRILVTQNNNKHTSPPLPVCFAITGIGIIAAVVVVVISAMYVIRRRCHWSSSYYMHNDYENIPSSSPCKLRPYLLYSYICSYIATYVTGFAKRSLIHTSDFANLMSHNFVCDYAVTFKFSPKFSLMMGKFSRKNSKL